jgi:hypothetical protein
MFSKVYAQTLLLGITIISSTQCISSLRNDVVVLVNGNSVTGEIQFLEFGNLNYETDSMGTVDIDWEDIVSVTSNQYVEVEIATGKRYYGSIELSPAVNTISIGFGEEVDLISQNDVIRITPIDRSEMFIKRLEGSFSFGLTTAKATEVSVGRFEADVSYRTENYLVGLRIESSVTDQKDEDISKRQFLGMNYQRFRPNRWFTEYSANSEQNDELGIEARHSAGVGIGRYIVQTNRNQFSLITGLVATRESFTSSESSTTNGEGRISVKYLHRSIVPESDVSFTYDIYPLLEDPSTFRSEASLTFRREFIQDLFLDFTFYHSYLSDPTADPTDSTFDVEKEDYGVTTSLGYRF